MYHQHETNKENPGPGKPEFKYIDNTAHFTTNKHHQELITIASQ